MLKKTLSYTNFDDQEVTETHYFHLTKAELVELEMDKQGGLEKYLRRIIEAQDGGAIIREFKKIVLLAYGKKSDDGTKFIKTEELRKDFESSEAYSALFMELVTDAGKAADFINGIMPKGMKEDLAVMGQPRPQAKAQVDPGEIPVSERTEAELPGTENVFDANNPKILTPGEVVEMDADELKSGLATGKYKLQ